MPSPKPRPTVLKLIEGRGPGRDSGGREVKQTPGFTRLPPNAPSWLPAEARAEWKRVVPELARLELLKPVDRAALTAYCLAWDRLVTGQKAIKENGGHTYTDAFGNPKKHPAVLITEAASKELRAWAAEFGLTPSAEQRLGKLGADDGEEDSNPFAG
jgi:P27 family predicted phage terminase small subunit